MFGQFGNAGGFGTGGEFERLTRQYWDAWGQALRGAAPSPEPSPAQAGMQAWQDALQWWRGQFAGTPVVGDTLERFGQQAGHWYAQMQQVAAQFGGHGGRPADVVEAWKTALGGASANLFQHLFDSMNGPGMQGMDQWLRGVQPVLDAFKGEGSTWLNTPAFGFTREHQERWQSLHTLADAALPAPVRKLLEGIASLDYAASARPKRISTQSKGTNTAPASLRSIKPNSSSAATSRCTLE